MLDEKCATTFTVNDISLFEKSKNGFQCGISCKFCTKTLKANYTSYWKAHNIKVHLKKHISKASQIQSAAAEQNQKTLSIQSKVTQSQTKATEIVIPFSQY